MIVEKTAFEELKEIWNELLQKNEVNEVFLTYEFVTNWWNVYGQGKELLLLKVTDNNEIIGIAPLMIENKVIKFIGDPHSDYHDFILVKNKDAAIKEIFEYLKSIKFKEVDLYEIKENSSTLDILRRLSYKKLEEVSSICPKIPIKTYFEDYLKSQMSRDSRKKLRQKNNKFIKNNGIFRHVEDVKNSSLENFFDVHRKEWSRTKTPSKFNYDINKEFYKEIIKNVKSDFYVLEFDRKEIAYHLGFIYNNKFISYTTAYDIDYTEYSPGLMLFYNLIKDIFDMGLKEFDFVRGAEAYKYKFVNGEGINHRIRLYKTLNLSFLIGNLVYRSKKILRKNTFVIDILRKIRKNYRYYFKNEK